jgi:hypothetical protein
MPASLPARGGLEFEDLTLTGRLWDHCNLPPPRRVLVAT